MKQNPIAAGIEMLVAINYSLPTPLIFQLTRRITSGILHGSSAGILVVLSGCTASTSVQIRPNVIYIFPDQFRQYSLGFWSQAGHDKYIQGKPDPVITPNLDKLANTGVVLSRAVSNFPLCSPHRGMLLTGMYPDQNGVTNNCRKDRDLGLKSKVICMTDVFFPRLAMMLPILANAIG